MASFDVYVNKIAEYVEGIRSNRGLVREMNRPVTDNDRLEDLPIRIGDGAQPNVILKEDTYVELGNPGQASCAFLLWTDTTSLISDGKITLIGPDINESKGKSLPFGQVLIVGGSGLNEEHQEMLEWGQYIADKIEGYMIRSVPQRMWSRVSREAAEKGFCFEILGRALMTVIKSELPIVEAIEILFVTSDKQDVEKLESIAKQVEKISRDIKKGKYVIEDDGTYVCTDGLDCSVCLDKDICDDIRELIVLRKGNKYGK